MLKRGLVASTALAVFVLCGAASDRAEAADSNDAARVKAAPQAKTLVAMVVPEGGARQDAAAACSAGMVEVEGDYCPSVEERCLRWEGGSARRCAEFAPTSVCHGKTTAKHFCIDHYEYPNRKGEKPAVMTTWEDAKALCASQGKRLCESTEWTLACEGQERLPYPYGYKRDRNACNIDRPHLTPNESLLASPSSRDAEAARLDQREASGTKPLCASPYGVMDMTGNVDEWVVNESGKPYKSGLKGGYWGPVRDRCRPMTTAHSEQFSFYQIGFRCCADAGG